MHKIYPKIITKISHTVPEKKLNRAAKNNILMTPAKMHLEQEAERMSPQEYICAKQYLSRLEREYFLKNPFSKIY